MPRSHNIDIEAERRSLIDLIKQTDLSEAMVRKVRSALTKPEKKELPPMPCQMTVEEVVARLRKQVAHPSQGYPTTRFLKQLHDGSCLGAYGVECQFRWYANQMGQSAANKFRKGIFSDVALIAKNPMVGKQEFGLNDFFGQQM